MALSLLTACIGAFESKTDLRHQITVVCDQLPESLRLWSHKPHPPQSHSVVWYCLLEGYLRLSTSLGGI